MQRVIRNLMQGVAASAMIWSAVAWAGPTDILIDPFANTAAEAATMLPTETATTSSAGAAHVAIRETVAPSTPRAATPVTVVEANAPASTAAWDLPWLRATVAFLFVASLIVVIGTIARRLFQSGSGFMGKRACPLRVVQTLPLGSKRTMYVVEFEGTQLLIGAAGTQLQLLHAKAGIVSPPPHPALSPKGEGSGYSAKSPTIGARHTPIVNRQSPIIPPQSPLRVNGAAAAVDPVTLNARNAVMELSQPIAATPERTPAHDDIAPTNGIAIASAEAVRHVTGLSAQIRSAVQSLRPIGARTPTSSNGSTI